MKRLTAEALEILANAHRRPIEFDNEAGIAVVVWNGTTYYAQLDAEVTSC